MGTHYPDLVTCGLLRIRPVIASPLPVALSPVAQAILEYVPPRHVTSLRAVADMTGYDYSYVRSGWHELVRARLAETVPYGRRNRYALVLRRTA